MVNDNNQVIANVQWTMINTKRNSNDKIQIYKWNSKLK